MAGCRVSCKFLVLCVVLLAVLPRSSGWERGRGRRSDDPQSWEVVVQTLSQRVAELEAKLQALENSQQQVAPVSFFVQFTEYHHHFTGDNTLLQFDNVISNVGNGYNANIGHFIAPRAGTYSFSLNLLSDHDHTVWQNVCIMRNNACVALTQLADSASLSVVLQLEAGDAVSALKRDGPGTSIYGINHTTFSGFLVTPAA